MHPKVKEALEQIDAAVFNGDTFEDPDARAELVDYMGRWARRYRLKAAINRDPNKCSKRADKTHCAHWQDGEKCCACQAGGMSCAERVSQGMEPPSPCTACGNVHEKGKPIKGCILR